MSARTKPCQSYIARGVESEDGDGWIAEYGFPGGYIRAVLDGADPVLFVTKDDAEIAAHRVLVASLNSRPRINNRKEISRKLSGDEFAHELGLTDIFPGEWATMWGTKQDRVMQQIEGVQEVPFAARWILPVLRKFPGALEYAQKIVAENTSVKPEWLERRPQRVESEG